MNLNEQLLENQDRVLKSVKSEECLQTADNKEMKEAEIKKAETSEVDKGAEETCNGGSEDEAPKAENENTLKKVEVIKIKSLCVVVMDSTSEATPNDKSDPLPSLVSGCSMATNGNKEPVVLVHCLKPNKSSDSNKSKSTKSQPTPPPSLPPDIGDGSFDMYDLFYDQDQPLDSLSIPTLPLSSSLSSKDGGLPCVFELQEIIPLHDFKMSATTGGIPIINLLVPIPGMNMIAVSVGTEDANPSDQFGKPVGGIVLFSVTRTEDDFTTLQKAPYKQLNFTDIGDVVVDMIPLQTIDNCGRSKTSLACVTKRGLLKVYDLLTLEYLCSYHAEDGSSFSHIVSCDRSPSTAVLATEGGSIQLVDVVLQRDVGVSDEGGDSAVVQLLKGE